MRHGFTILLDYNTPIGPRTMTLAMRHYETAAVRDIVKESELELLQAKYPPDSLRVSEWELSQ